MKINHETYYIVRCDRAGVYFGHITEANGSEVTLTNVRNIWRWRGASALPQLAVEGVKYPNDCRFTQTVAEITLLNAIEILPCSDRAVESIKGVSEWKA